MPAKKKRRNYIGLDRGAALVALCRLQESDDRHAMDTARAILHGLWESENDGLSLRLPVLNGEPALLESLSIPVGLLHCVRQPLWEAVYQHPEEPTVPDITFRSPDKPPTRKSFRGPGGNRRYVRVSLTELTEKDHPTMAKRRKTKAQDVVDIEELEEITDADVEEEEEVEEKPKRKRASKKTKTSKKSRKSSKSDDDAPKKKTRKKSGGKKPTPPVRELPKGKLGIDAIAEAADCDARKVRVFLRKNADDLGVEKTDGRWAFNKTEVKKIAKAINA